MMEFVKMLIFFGLVGICVGGLVMVLIFVYFWVGLFVLELLFEEVVIDVVCLIKDVVVVVWKGEEVELECKSGFNIDKGFDVVFVGLVGVVIVFGVLGFVWCELL